MHETLRSLLLSLPPAPELGVTVGGGEATDAEWLGVLKDAAEEFCEALPWHWEIQGQTPGKTEPEASRDYYEWLLLDGIAVMSTWPAVVSSWKGAWTYYRVGPDRDSYKGSGKNIDKRDVFSQKEARCKCEEYLIDLIRCGEVSLPPL